ncbi:hypothetical protein DSD19_06770 [Rhodovulum sp. BSW8]|nr:hypothetical protein DSD19_06770 [Rhodovulum sp. BSW8]
MPTSWNIPRVATMPLSPTCHSYCTATSPGFLPTTLSKLGSLSASRSIPSFTSAYSGRTGLNQTDVPETFGARPSEYRISVADWPMVTTLSGAASKETSSPQFVNVRG